MHWAVRQSAEPIRFVDSQKVDRYPLSEQARTRMLGPPGRPGGAHGNVPPVGADRFDSRVTAPRGVRSIVPRSNVAPGPSGGMVRTAVNDSTNPIASTRRYTGPGGVRAVADPFRVIGPGAWQFPVAPSQGWMVAGFPVPRRAPVMVLR